MPAATHLVGIDLGTTHTVVARARADGSGATELFPIPQVVAEGEIAPEALLPSVLFLPLPAELVADPWGDAPWLIGAYARARGQRAPGRCITSPKSWLGHGAIDRLAATLPWGTDATDDTLQRLSPVEASRRILDHVRRAYDQAWGDAPLQHQDVVLTVPASFDEVARELTVRAAVEAGLTVRLLEEPLAAFYDHLALVGTAGVEALLVGSATEAFVLVCDVGGGTTDLTLIRVARDGGGVRLDRVAVGRHLLLGGDNMDLALAHSLEPVLAAPHERLEPALFAELHLACRAAKERLLAPDPPGSLPIRVLSRGSALVGKTLSAELARTDVEALVLGGFFPVVDPAAPAQVRAALVGFGLPYERDPAITRHVAVFLARHLPVGRGPGAVLLNGGVFRAPSVRQRLLDVLEAGAGVRPIELAAPDPDLAVARGAVAFGLALSGKGPRVGGGSARGYYVGLAASGAERRAICVVPRGAAEGERHGVAVAGLSLVVGEPVRFDLFSADSGRHAAGTIVPVDPTFDALPSMTTAFDRAGGAGETRVPVHLEGELTAVGTLDVACVESSGISGHFAAPRRFRLAFDLRARPARTSTAPPGSIRPSDPKLALGREAIARVFGKGRADAEAREARHLVRELEKILGDRAGWTTEVSRTLCDAVLPESKARRRSPEHERAFWMLTGFSGRPGYGHPLDPKRIAKIVPLLAELVVFPDEARTWQQFWIAWRRLAGGLGEPAQIWLRDLIDPFLSTDDVKPKKKKGLKPQAPDEMLDLAASLEAVPPARRADLGRWILERTWTSRDPRLWTALGRVGARVPTYASAHHVVPPSAVERWLDHLMREKWEDMPTAARAAVQMARVTGDRSRDVAEGQRRDIARRLGAAGAPPEWQRAVLELVPVARSEQDEFFGESLPVGLELVRGG